MTVKHGDSSPARMGAERITVRRQGLPDKGPIRVTETRVHGQGKYTSRDPSENR